MKHYAKSYLYCLAFVTLALTGCNAGSGEGLDQQGQPIVESPPQDDTPPIDSDSDVDNDNDTNEEPPVEEPIDDGSIQPTLASIQEQVFSPICSTCHGGVSPAAGQNLSTIEDSVANLINVQSSNALFKRVEPGEPELSYLYLKVTGDSQAGARMPLGQPALAEDQIEAIREWIAQGALVDGQSAAPVVVNQVNHTSQAGKGSTPQQKVTIQFNQAMDFSGLSNEQITVTLLTQGNDDLAQTTELTHEQVQWSIQGEHTLQLNITLAANTEQRGTSETSILRVILNNSDISTLYSQFGRELDGDNDGIDGGEFIYEFSL